jgi:hypothetical protein
MGQLSLTECWQLNKKNYLHNSWPAGAYLLGRYLWHLICKVNARYDDFRPGVQVFFIEAVRSILVL